MFKNLRFFLLINSTFNKILSILKPKGTKGQKMTVTVTSIIQIVAVLLTFTDQLSSILPPEYKLWTAVGISALQGVNAILAHFKNPDGTPSTTPYTPPSTMK